MNERTLVGPGRKAPWRALLSMSFLLAGSSHAADEPERVWQGELTVHQQQGPQCGSAAAKVPVFLAQLPPDAPGNGALLVWGAMQTAWLKSVPGQPGSYEIQLDAPAGTGGRARLHRDAEGGWSGDWSEAAARAGASRSAACRWIAAGLTATPAAETDRRSLHDYSRYLVEVQSTLAQMQNATRRSELRTAAERLVLLAARRPGEGSRHQALAQWFLAAGEMAAATRTPDLGVRLLAASSAIYRQLAPEMPQNTALALLGEAVAQRRANDHARAFALLEEAMQLLRDSDRLESAAGSNVLNLLGSWRLRDGRSADAIPLLREAANLDEKRGSSSDQAVSLNNLGQALERSGADEQSETVFGQALALAQSLPSESGSSLVEVIANNLQLLQQKRQSRITRGAQLSENPGLTQLPSTRPTTTAQTLQSQQEAAVSPPHQRKA